MYISCSPDPTNNSKTTDPKFFDCTKLLGHGSKRKLQYEKVIFGPVQNYLRKYLDKPKYFCPLPNLLEGQDK